MVQKCAAHDLSSRYPNVLELISDLERLEATPTVSQPPA
jgi:hypothetical protein